VTNSSNFSYFQIFEQTKLANIQFFKKLKKRWCINAPLAVKLLRRNHSLAMEPHSTQDATKRVTWILDAKYKKEDLQSIVRNNCKHLSANHEKKLLQLLKKYETLFDGTLGDWKTKPVLFQLREGISPKHG
jgi:hypothetical protein